MQGDNHIPGWPARRLPGGRVVEPGRGGVHPDRLTMAAVAGVPHRSAGRR
ncbi:hypothetical protein ACIBJE_00485 [Micromonospora sp. NPDC050187]